MSAALSPTPTTREVPWDYLRERYEGEELLAAHWEGDELHVELSDHIAVFPCDPRLYDPMAADAIVRAVAPLCSTTAPAGA